MSFGKKRLTLAKDGILCVYLVLDQFGFKKFNCDFLFVILNINFVSSALLPAYSLSLIFFIRANIEATDRPRTRIRR